jgi:hypothetical protein
LHIGTPSCGKNQINNNSARKRLSNYIKDRLADFCPDCKGKMRFFPRKSHFFTGIPPGDRNVFVEFDILSAFKLCKTTKNACFVNFGFLGS